MERLNFDHLFYFYTVAKEGSVKAASKKLHLTQPTISGQIRQLEEQLGFDVFIRKHRKLELSEHGKFLLKKAERLFLIADELVSTLPKHGKAPRTEIKIGAIQSLSNSFIYDFSLKVWKDKTIAVSVTQGPIQELIEKMNKGEIHLILSDTSYQRSKRYKARNLGEDKIVAVASQKFKHLRKDFPKSLNDEPYLSFSNQGRLQEEVDYFFEREGVQPERVGQVDDVTLMRVVAENGSAFAVMPYRAAKESIKLGKLTILGELKQLKSSLWVITSSSASNRVVVKKIINDYFIRQK